MRSPCDGAPYVNIADARDLNLLQNNVVRSKVLCVQRYLHAWSRKAHTTHSCSRAPGEHGDIYICYSIIALKGSRALHPVNKSDRLFNPPSLCSQLPHFWKPSTCLQLDSKSTVYLAVSLTYKQ